MFVGRVTNVEVGLEWTSNIEGAPVVMENSLLVKKGMRDEKGKKDKPRG